MNRPRPLPWNQSGFVYQVCRKVEATAGRPVGDRLDPIVGNNNLILLQSYATNLIKVSDVNVKHDGEQGELRPN